MTCLFCLSSLCAAQTSSVATIVIRGATMNILDDIERAIDDAVHGYKTLTRDARLVAGAGAAEMQLAKELRTLGESQAALEQYAVLKFSEALEVVPRVLLENSGADATHAIANLTGKLICKCVAWDGLLLTYVCVCVAIIQRSIRRVTATVVSMSTTAKSVTSSRYQNSNRQSVLSFLTQLYRTCISTTRCWPRNGPFSSQWMLQ